MGPIVINARAAARPELGGVERWARELARRLPELRPGAYEVVRPRPRLVHRLGHAWEQATLPVIARRLDARAILSPANLAPVAWARNVVVVHDAAALRHPEWYSGSYVAWQRAVLRPLARRALRVITVSRFSRGELVELLGVPRERIEVVPGGVDERFTPAADAERAAAALGLKRPYVLTVGSLIARKNLAALEPAAAALRERGIDLVAAGGGRPQLRSEGVASGVTALGHVPDERAPGAVRRRARVRARVALRGLRPDVHRGDGVRNPRRRGERRRIAGDVRGRRPPRRSRGPRRDRARRHARRRGPDLAPPPRRRRQRPRGGAHMGPGRAFGRRPPPAGDGMRVGVDGRTLVKGRRGVARYTLGLLTALAHLNGDDEYVVLLPPGPERDAATKQLEALPSVTVVRGSGPRRARFASAALSGRPRIDRELGGGLDVVWLPEPAPVAVSKDVPVVLTVHDLSWEQRPQDFTVYERSWLKLARPAALAKRAARVIAVSDATRREALARWDLDGERVRVVHSGVEAGRPESGGRYLLFVGALEPRKGIDVLADAYAAARADGLTAPLVVAGDGRLRSLLRGDGVRLVGHAADDELARLYGGAVALVLPSRLEGFGFPPLEALARGKPSVLTDLAVFRETLGDAARYVPVDDAGALAAAMLEVAGDPDLRARLVDAGRPALERLTWERAAAETHAVLEAAAGA